MSLDWNLSAIPNHKELWVEAGEDAEGKKQYKLNSTTESIIWMCLATGIGEITPGNWEEWFLRARVWEMSHGALRGQGKKQVYLKPEEVKAHIGLKTNVFPKSTAAAFAKKLVHLLEREGREELYEFKRKEQACEAQRSTAGTVSQPR